MSIPLESFENDADLFRILLEPKGEGVYVFVFETADSKIPEWDHRQDTLQDAVDFCVEQYGVPANSWRATTTNP